MLLIDLQQTLPAHAAARQDSSSLNSLLIRPADGTNQHAAQRQLPMPFLYRPEEAEPAKTTTTAAAAEHVRARRSSHGRTGGSSSSRSSSQQGHIQQATGALDGLLVPTASEGVLTPPPVKAGGYNDEQTDKSNKGHASKDSKQTKDKDKDKGPQNGFTGGRPPRQPICTSIPGCQYCPNGGRCQQCLFDGVAKFVRNGRGGCGKKSCCSTRWLALDV
jgi:hypothetical protein